MDRISPRPSLLKIGIFGGRFDPIHAGHLAIIERAITHHHLDVVHIVPSASPPHKPVVAAYTDREAMIKLALRDRGIPPTQVLIDDREHCRQLNDGTPSWTIDTVVSIQNEHPGADLWLIIGSDTALQLQTWHRASELLQMVSLLVMARRPVQTADVALHLHTKFPEFNRPLIVDSTFDLPVSSTTLRGSTAGPHLSESVADYIQSRGLYRQPIVKVLGITGRVGSGKTTASDYLSSQFTIELIDLDKVGHTLLTQPDVQADIRLAFGDQVFNDGVIDRKRLGQLVFSSPDQLHRLNAIMHPRIREVAVRVISAAQNPVVIVGALLDEIGILPLCTVVWVIDSDDAPIETAIGAKFNIRHSQQSREAYQRQGKVIVNTFDERFIETLRSNYLALGR
ncbi:nicotinate (nicotinamide) nucleotide adenylyltransferase [bacterium]|nr:nicotinate (nicotinamide) nucleotide adenylyltransferase [bacterium]